jgi:predicted transcriptional regulator
MKATTTIDAADLNSLGQKLRSVTPQARKLLAKIAELAYHGRGEDRQPDTAYLPELHESCGLDVEAMYETLDELKRAGLIVIEKEYPFEDIAIAKERSGINAIAEITRACGLKHIGLRDVLVDMRFDLLQ